MAKIKKRFTCRYGFSFLGGCETKTKPEKLEKLAKVVDIKYFSFSSFSKFLRCLEKLKLGVANS